MSLLIWLLKNIIVIREFIKKNDIQEIGKSTWFELGKNDRDTPMYEYCIVTPRYDSVLSIVWED